jgi:hypothetical protein
MREKKKMVNKDYENNISEDIVYANDTLKSAWTKMSNKLDKKGKPFFLVVLDKDEKILGVIRAKELRNMLDQAKSKDMLDIPFGSNIVQHTIIKESEISTKATTELKKEENLGFILIKNDNGNYIGKKYSN